MISYAALLVIVATVLQTALTQQPKISVCVDILGGGCKNENSQEDVSPSLVLQNGFTEGNKTLQAAENTAINGLAKARNLAINQPQAALQAVEESMEKAKSLFFDSGTFVFYSLGKALSLSNTGARQKLIESTLHLQFAALNVFDEMRIISTLMKQGTDLGGNALKQAIEAVSLNFQAAFVPIYDQMQNSLQLSTEAIEYAQRNPVPRTVANRNAGAGTQDSDALAAISEINKAAASSISRGAPESKVKQLSEALATAIADVAEIQLSLRSNLLTIQNLSSDSDPTSAKNDFLKISDEASMRIQNIFASICLEFGSVGAGLSQKQLKNVFVSMEHGDDEITYGNNVAKELVLSAFNYEGNGRKLILDAAAQVARYGHIAFNQRIIDAVKFAFNEL